MSLEGKLAFCYNNKNKFAGTTVVVHEKREKREKKRESKAEESEECLRRFLSERETIVEIVSEEILCWTSKFEEKFKYNYKLPFDSISFAFHLPAEPSNQHQEQPVED